VLLSPPEQALHEECKRLRNKALAHSEHALNPTSLNDERSVVMSKPFSLFIHPVNRHDLIALLSKVRQACLVARAQYMSAQS
jgi:hypothetical protein